MSNEPKDVKSPDLSQFSSTDPYIVLGLPPTATIKDVKQARNKLQKHFHTDVSQNPKALEISTAINNAATELINQLERQPAPASVGDEPRQPDQSSNRGRRRQRGGRGQNHERQRGRGRAEQPTPEPQPEKDPAQVKAQALYATSLDQVYAILYNPNVKRQAEDGVTEEKIPEADRSYTAVIRSKAEAKLMFDYNVEPPAPTATKKPKGHKKSRPERP